MKAIVTVRLKREVLDPQGDAVARALSRQGFASVRGARVGKLVELELADDVSPDAARAELAKMADALLANPVTEDYEINVVGEPCRGEVIS